jgi:hypothetical protein
MLFEGFGVVPYQCYCHFPLPHTANFTKLISQLHQEGVPKSYKKVTVSHTEKSKVGTVFSSLAEPGKGALLTSAGSLNVAVCLGIIMVIQL